VKRYNIDFQETYLILIPNGFTNNNRKDIQPELFIKQKYPTVFNHLEQYEEKCKKRYDKGDYWWELRACDYYSEFEKPKIIYPNICKGPEFSYDEKSYYTNQKCFIISKDDKYLLGILNSSIFGFLFNMILPKLRGGFFEPSYTYMKDFPIVEPNINSSLNHQIAQHADTQLTQNTELEKNMSSFTKLLQSKFNLDTLSNKLQNWQELEFNEFLAELKKSKIKLSLSEETEWMEYFNEQKAKALELKAEIDKTDKEIDQMVYELYGLTDEEIKIVEENVKS